MAAADRTWPIQDAKARFSEMIDVCVSEGPQVVTKRGRETAVVISIEEWRRLQKSARPSLKQLLLAEEGRTEAFTPERRPVARRPAPDLD